MRSGFLAHSLSVARKDWMVESRSFTGLASTALFALVTLAVLSLSVGPGGAEGDLLAALLWVLLLFAGMAGLAQGFVREFDAHTAGHLKLLARPHEVLAGKALLNFWLLALVEMLVVPLYLGVMAPRVQSWGVFLGTLALADLGLVAVSTLFAGIVAQSRARGALYAGLCIPVLIPLLLAAVGGTKAAFGVTPDARTHLVTLAPFDAVLVGAAMLLIEPVWNE